MGVSFHVREEEYLGCDEYHDRNDNKRSFHEVLESRGGGGFREYIYSRYLKDLQQVAILAETALQSKAAHMK